MQLDVESLRTLIAVVDSGGHDAGGDPSRECRSRR